MGINDITIVNIPYQMHLVQPLPCTENRGCKSLLFGLLLLYWIEVVHSPQWVLFACRRCEKMATWFQKSCKKNGSHEWIVRCFAPFWLHIHYLWLVSFEPSNGCKCCNKWHRPTTIHAKEQEVIGDLMTKLSRSTRRPWSMASMHFTKYLISNSITSYFIIIPSRIVVMGK